MAKKTYGEYSYSKIVKDKIFFFITWGCVKTKVLIQPF